MNTSTEPRRCPACTAEIPAEAPQGLCPKCLLMGVASVAESSVKPGSSAARATSYLDAPPRGRVGGGTNDNRSDPPSVEELAPAFPQLEIIELIGRGGMGFVYKARQPKLDRFVALKILPGHLANEPSFHERFEREARVLAKLQHPLIVGIYDFGETVSLQRASESPELPDRHRANDIPIRNPSSDAHEPAVPAAAPGFFYLVLEYVDGVNLREAMRAGRFTPDQALAIVPQVCEALQYAHSKNVLHRDIKPENILLDIDGRVKIADFGIAKVLGPEMDVSSNQFAVGEASESEMAVTRLTATGSVLGTPLYMAPEQLIRPNSVDHRADIFSLGVVFYEMLTGELPMGRFAPPSEKSLVDRHIDQRIDDVVLRALAKERELRQQSAGELKTDVETIVSHPQNAAKSPSAHAGSAPTRQKGFSGDVALTEHESLWLTQTFWLQLRRVIWMIASIIWIPILTVLTLIVMGIGIPVFFRQRLHLPQPMLHLPQTIKFENAENEATSPSAASIEATRLGLIRVADTPSEVRVNQQPIEISGVDGPVSINPHFSTLVRLPVSTNQLKWTMSERDGSHVQYSTVANYPCDYIACDWSSGMDSPPIMGYVLPPGAYDFRADVKTSQHLTTTDAAGRAEIASLALKFVAESTSMSAATESDWQQATLATHLRFNFVPKSISKLDVPDECLVVLSDDSRTIFTREGGRFTKHELVSAELTRGLHDYIGKSANTSLNAEVKDVIERAQRAVRQQNWEGLQSFMTLDCVDEWMFEATNVGQLAPIHLEERADGSDPKSKDAIDTLIQLNRELQSFKRPISPLDEKRLELRYKSYPTLTAAERRQLRIDFMRANYTNTVDLATTVLTFVQQLDTTQLVFDLSTISELHFDGRERVTGTWTTKDGKRTPIVFMAHYLEGGRSWMIDSLVGKSVLDQPASFASPLDKMMPATSGPSTPADASVPDNASDDDK